MTRRANSLVIASSLPNESGENQLAPSGPNAIPTAVAITSKVQINQLFWVVSAQVVENEYFTGFRQIESLFDKS